MGDYDERGPFGNPDGANEESKNFLRFSRIFPGLDGKKRISHDLDSAARVIVGKKGAGKSLYLKISMEQNAKRTDLHLTQTNEAPPPTERIIEINALFSQADKDEYWTRLWRRAIISSVASHFFAASGVTKLFRDAIDHADSLLETDRPRNSERDYENTRARFMLQFSSVMPRWQTPQSICNQIVNMLRSHQNRNAVIAYLDDPAWDSVENVIATCLEHCKPLVYYIDAIDDRFEKGPTAWVECQRGLFNAVLEISRNRIFNHKIYVFCCIRDVVYAEIMNSTEHVTKYMKNRRIHLLNWDYQASSEFVKRKIEALRSALRAQTSGGANFDGFKLLLQRETIENDLRKITEPVDQYVLRHTRLLPRDLVNMGNALYAERARCQELSQPVVFNDARIRKVVSRIAGMIGQEALRTVVIHLGASVSAKDTAPIDQQTEGNRTEWLSAFFREVVVGAINSIGRDVFSTADLSRVRSEVDDKLEGSGLRLASGPSITSRHILKTLWHHGLLGTRSQTGGKARDAFHFVVDSTLEADLPRSELYVLHSCLIDTRDVVVRSFGKTPVTVS